FAEVPARHRVVMAVQAAQYHEERLRRHPEDYDPNFTSLLREGLACPAPEYARALEHRRQLRFQLGDLLDECGDCVLLMPAARGPAPDAATTGDPLFNSPWSYLGFPVVSLPTGLVGDRLPVGIQCVGAPDKEYNVFQAALWCEKALGVELGEPPC